MNILDLEHAAFSSCPAVEQSSVSGLVLRSNGGYTKRANSANQLAGSDADLETIIEGCESYFAERKQRSVFRLLSICGDNLLDQQLKLRDYKHIEKSYVMAQAAHLIYSVKHSIEPLSDSEWIDSFYQLSSDSDIFRQQHLQMIQTISAPHFMAVQRDHRGNIAAQGIGVVENGYFGIFNIVTGENHQRQRFSQQLISGLMNWAYSINAHTAYVQVKAENVPAVALYKKLGYCEQYYYWYRVKGEQNV